MDPASHVAVVIPCLNEAKTIRTLVAEVRQMLPTVIVVDDGSTDGTAAEATRGGAQVLVHNSPRGKGAALAAGFHGALARRFEWALAMDGDGQHAASDIPRFLARLGSNPPAMLIGNRMREPFSMPFRRRVVNRWMSRRIGAYCGKDLPDSQCGFRLVNLRCWKRFRFSAKHFEIESELIVRFLHAGFSVDFVPVQTRYALECSKIRPLADTIRWFRWWRAIRRELALHEPSFSPREPEFTATPQDATA